MLVSSKILTCLVRNLNLPLLGGEKKPCCSLECGRPSLSFTSRLEIVDLQQAVGWWSTSISLFWFTVQRLLLISEMLRSSAETSSSTKRTQQPNRRKKLPKTNFRRPDPKNIARGSSDFSFSLGLLLPAWTASVRFFRFGFFKKKLVPCDFWMNCKVLFFPRFPLFLLCLMKLMINQRLLWDGISLSKICSPNLILPKNARKSATAGSLQRNCQIWRGGAPRPVLELTPGVEPAA